MMSHYFRDEKGGVLILSAIFLTAVMGFAAITLDAGMSMVQQHRLQSAIDAAALAAAAELPNTTQATNVANDYIQRNGFSPSSIVISFSDSDRRIDISASQPTTYFFARVFGVESGSVGSRTAATVRPMGGPFDYALFSGSSSSTLTCNGSHLYVGGSSHSNRDCVINGSDITITGSCEAVTTITTNGSDLSIGSREPYASFIEMPDFSDALRAQALSAGQLYHGDKIFNGSNISVDQPIYVEGNVIVNGSRFHGKGCILATGNITFNGSNLVDSTSDAVCFYSQNGNIVVNGSNIELHGIVYAPRGEITFNGSSQTVKGRVIGNIARLNGSHQRIISGANDLDCLPTKGVKLVR